MRRPIERFWAGIPRRYSKPLETRAAARRFPLRRECQAVEIGLAMRESYLSDLETEAVDF